MNPLSFICYETQAIQKKREQLGLQTTNCNPIGSSSEKERKVNALASGADEGRD